MPLLSSIASAAIASITESKWDPQNLANLVWAYAKLIVHVKPLLHALSAESIKIISDFKPMELPITFWAFATLTLDDEPLIAAISSASSRIITSLQMLDLSNTAWALALMSKTDQPLLESIASQASALLGGVSFQSHLGNPLSLIWAFWRLHQERLGPQLFKQFSDIGILVELISCGVVLMGNDWGKLQPVEVHMEEAMQVVCFWSEADTWAIDGMSHGLADDVVG